MFFELLTIWIGLTLFPVSFKSDGYDWIRKICSTSCILELRATCQALTERSTARSGGVRQLLQRSKLIRDLALGEWRHRIQDLLHTEIEPVRGILFDKSQHANWKVPWHQDRVIAVRHPVDLPGFLAPSLKEGIPHVQPPREILQKMITLRLHLDDCDSKSGALKILPRSHLLGILEADEFQPFVEANRENPASCDAESGDAFLMRPLLIHASSLATDDRRRRVIHLEYAQRGILPTPVEWPLLHSPA